MITPIDKFLITGKREFSDSFILRDLNLKILDSLSYKDISRKIDWLTATKNFSEFRKKIYSEHKLDNVFSLDLVMNQDL